MELTYNTFVAFCCGFAFAYLWFRLVSLGQTIIMVKTTINDCLLIMAKNIQTAYESNELKYHAMEIANKDSKYIEFQKKVDNSQLLSLQNTIIRNFINSIPTRYSRLVKFSDWKTAMSHLDDTIGGSKDDKNH